MEQAEFRLRVMTTLASAGSASACRFLNRSFHEIQRPKLDEVRSADWRISIAQSLGVLSEEFILTARKSIEEVDAVEFVDFTYQLRGHRGPPYDVAVRLLREF